MNEFAAPAFPVNRGNCAGEPGISKREYFAGLAMANIQNVATEHERLLEVCEMPGIEIIGVAKK